MEVPVHSIDSHYILKAKKTCPSLVKKFTFNRKLNVWIIVLNVQYNLWIYFIWIWLKRTFFPFASEGMNAIKH